MTQPAEAYAAQAEQLEGAQAMAGWFEKYLLGVSSELGEVPPLAYERCQELLGDMELTEQSFANLTDVLLGQVGDAQSDVAYYMCGYPDSALLVFGSTRLEENIEAFRQSALAHLKPHLELVRSEPPSSVVSRQVGKVVGSDEFTVGQSLQSRSTLRR